MVERSYRWETTYRTTRGRRPEPILPVAFAYTRVTVDHGGLVDSGAAFSACSVQIAREAGLDPERFPLEPIRGIGGVTRVRRCPIDPLILGRRIGTEILVVEAKVVVLGRRDVFAAFQFGFDERAQTLLIEPYDEA